MTDCERYRNDPEANAAHVDQCTECRELAIELARIEGDLSDLSVQPKPEFHDQVATRLPLAPWEDARYQSWGLTVTVLVTLSLLVSGAFMAVGVSPIRAARALGSTMLPLVSPWTLAQSFSTLISSAPARFHITIGVLFVVVNLILLVLLRRPPRGYDA